MTQKFPNDGEVIKTGSFRYQNTTEVWIRIVKKTVKPGSGDHEDDTDIREDQSGVWFEITYGSAGPENFTNSGGYFSSLSEATKVAEEKFPSVCWTAETHY